MKVLVAAGGTGGHITPGLAIANKLKEEGNNVIFVGTTGGMEVDLVPKAGFELRYIHARGLTSGIKAKVRAGIELIKGISEVKKIIKEEKIDLVVGTGGYVTAPAMIAALRLKIPTLIHESNALPGKTTKLLASKVDVVAVGFKEAIERLPDAKHIVFTGNPTKLQDSLSKNECKNKLGIEKPMVLVFGGSQGAKKINEVMIELINNFKDDEYNIIYATGPKNYDEIISKISNNTSSIKIEKYIYNMEEVMSAADLAVCRSGALTVTELGIVGLPAILIPFPYAAENHQYYNAKTISDSGAGIIIEEKDLTYEKLKKQIDLLITNKDMLGEMSIHAEKNEMKGAIEKIMCEIEKIIKN